MKFQCIKGMATPEYVIAMVDDVVELVSTDEGDVVVRGYAGWCEEVELTLTPKQFVKHFKVLGLNHVLKQLS
jgi:hypothetical protein